jgi:hypothetical protein
MVAEKVRNKRGLAVGPAVAATVVFGAARPGVQDSGRVADRKAVPPVDLRSLVDGPGLGRSARVRPRPRLLAPKCLHSIW